MKVILLENIKNLGKQYEIKEVSEGYARNLLIPKGLVKIATEKDLKWAETQRKMKGEKAEEELKKTQELAAKIDGRGIMMNAKLNDEGKLFGSINATKIAQALKEKGYDVKKNQIALEEPIKEMGEWPVKLIFPHGLEAEITIIISEGEEERGEEEEEI